MKSFFGNVYELLALLCDSTELKQSISVPSESVMIRPKVSFYECLG